MHKQITVILLAMIALMAIGPTSQAAAPVVI